jgi:hypothetical protein
MRPAQAPAFRGPPNTDPGGPTGKTTSFAGLLIGAPGSQPGMLGLWAVGGQPLVTWAVRGRNIRKAA